MNANDVNKRNKEWMIVIIIIYLFYFVMYGNIRYWGYVSRMVTNTLRTIKGATDVRSNCLYRWLFILFSCNLPQ